MSNSLSDTAKLMLLTSLLVKDNIISENGRCLLKGMFMSMTVACIQRFTSFYHTLCCRFLVVCLNLARFLFLPIVHFMYLSLYVPPQFYASFLSYVCVFVKSIIYIELMLRKDPRLTTLLQHFEGSDSQDASFLEYLHALIGLSLFLHTSKDDPRIDTYIYNSLSFHKNKQTFCYP